MVAVVVAPALRLRLARCRRARENGKVANSATKSSATAVHTIVGWSPKVTRNTQIVITVITRDPKTGVQNYGTYRMQVYDKQTTGMHWQTHKVGTHHYRLSHELGLEKLDVAAALGGDPATIWTGSAPLPPRPSQPQGA